MTLTFEELLPLISDYQFKSCRYLTNFGVDVKKINWLYEQEVKDRFDKPHLSQTVFADKKLKAAALFRELAFDSDILNRKTGKIDFILADSVDAVQELIRKLVSTFSQLNLEYITYRLNIEDSEVIAALEANGFEKVDGYNILLTKIKEGNYVEEDSISIREATEADISQLQQTIAPSFSYSRFFADPLISRDSAIKMHQEWIANSIKGQVADQVLVAVVDGRPVGFITMEMDKTSQVIDKKIGHIPLIGVDPEFRGRHIGSILTKAAFEGWFKDMGAELVRVETQANNLPANKTYLNNGFTIVEKSVTLRWSSQK